MLFTNGYHRATAPAPPACGSLHQILHFYGYSPAEIDTVVLTWYLPDTGFSEPLGTQSIPMQALACEGVADEGYFNAGHPAPLTVLDRDGHIDSLQLWHDSFVPLYPKTNRLCDVEVTLLPGNQRVRFSDVRLSGQHSPIHTIGCDHQVISCRRSDGEQGYLSFVKPGL